MPPRFKFTKEEIINKAVSLVRENGINALTARALGEKLELTHVLNKKATEEKFENAFIKIVKEGIK